MATRTPFFLHSVSVVVTAQFHNPSILNPDFLRRLKIVPESWEVTEALTTPPVAVVAFKNGVRWTVEQNRMVVTEAINDSFADRYRVHGLASAYVEKLPHVPYLSLGLNCQVSMKRRAPQKWLVQRFLKPGAWLDGAPPITDMVPTLTLKADDAACTLTFKGANVQPPGGEPTPSVVAECNVHHEGPFPAIDTLQAAIMQWPERQEFIVQALTALLRSRQS